MKVAVYYENGGPEVMRYEEVPDPICGHDELLIRVEAISVEGGDLLHRQSFPHERWPHIAGIVTNRSIGTAYPRPQPAGLSSRRQQPFGRQRGWARLLKINVVIK